MMKLVYSAKELRNIDVAIPKVYWDGKDKSIQVDTAIHVVNYNEPNRMGKLENMEEIAKERGIDLEKGLSKAQQLARDFGYATELQLVEENMFSSVVPGICMMSDCDYTTDVEPDQDQGWCECCNMNSVQSILIITNLV